MSDYVRSKVIRVPVPKEIYLNCEKDKVCDICEEWLEKRQGIISHKDKLNNFEFEVAVDYNTDEIKYYYDYVLFYSYGEDSDDFGRTRALTDNEKNKYRKKFLDIGLDIEQARYVDYCYYNCSECRDYFDETTDEFFNEI